MQRPADLDIRIMKELTSPSSFRWDIRESYGSIAAKIGVDEETVRRRVNRARESGFLKGWQVVLNPHVIGRESAGAQLTVDDENRKGSVISDIEKSDGVVIMINFHGKSLRVIFYHKGDKDLADKIQGFSSICQSEQPIVWRGGFPSSSVKLKRTDWEIILALRKDPRRSPSEIADEVGVSTRTVKRRITGLTRGLAFYLLPMLDYRKYPGVAVDFLVFCPDLQKKYQLDKLVRAKTDRIIFSFIDAKGFSIYAILCLNISEAENIHDWLKGLDGVEKVTMDTMRNNSVVRGWLDEEIGNHLATTQAV
ncbi:MAG TPA: AsnC family transcriptional regulator [Candidatus Bathyarchaeia archaeon]|nr:AsnC family transcriptional regulator [Candidatus Bathyarchaeia archaeon]